MATTHLPLCYTKGSAPAAAGSPTSSPMGASRVHVGCCLLACSDAATLSGSAHDRTAHPATPYILRHSLRVPHSKQLTREWGARRYPERNDTTTGETVVAHGAAWADNLNPTLKRVWELGLQSVHLRDKLQVVMAKLGRPLPPRPICGHCHLNGYGAGSKRQRGPSEQRSRVQGERKLLGLPDDHRRMAR
jgi:hypothetical protein